MPYIFWLTVFDEMMADLCELWWAHEYERVMRELGI